MDVSGPVHDEGFGGVGHGERRTVPRRIGAVDLGEDGSGVGGGGESEKAVAWIIPLLGDGLVLFGMGNFDTDGFPAF